MDSRADIMTQREIQTRIDIIVTLAGKSLGMPSGLPEYRMNHTLAERVNNEIIQMIWNELSQTPEIPEHMKIRPDNVIIRVQDHNGLKRAYVFFLDGDRMYTGKGYGIDFDNAAFEASGMALINNTYGV